MPPEDFPRTGEEITPAWLSSVLGASVRGFDVAFLDSGIVSDAFRLHAITYDGEPGDAPSSVVVKLASRVQELRASAMMGDVYAKELNFYQCLAAQVPLAVPKIHACFSDGSNGSEFFIIVMEDLTSHSQVFDVVDDPPNEAWARRIAGEAAALHARFWESETTRLPLIGRDDRHYVFGLHALSAMGQSTWPMYRALWAQMYGRDIFDDDAWKPVAALTELLCGPKGPAIHDAIYAILSSRPRTVLHGDMRGDNIFRRLPTAGARADDGALTFIDWQLVHAGPPGPEFTQAWQHSLEPADRRKEREMLKEYHETLIALNPAAALYTYDMLLEDYILSYCFWWTAVIALGVGRLPGFDKPGSSRTKAAWSTGIFRAMTAMRELDCLSRVERLAVAIPGV